MFLNFGDHLKIFERGYLCEFLKNSIGMINRNKISNQKILISKFLIKEEISQKMHTFLIEYLSVKKPVHLNVLA